MPLGIGDEEEWLRELAGDTVFSHGKLKKHLELISSCRAMLKRDLILSYKWKTSLGQARQPVFWTNPMEKRLKWQFYLYLFMFIHPTKISMPAGHKAY